jgi:hypothetical protein
MILPFSLVVSENVNGLMTPVETTPSVYISIIMEEHDCVVVIQKLRKANGDRRHQIDLPSSI